jgi:hypothetical protein
MVLPVRRPGPPLEDTDPAAIPRDSEPTAIFAAPTPDVPEADPDDVVDLDPTPAPVPTAPRRVPPASKR